MVSPRATHTGAQVDTRASFPFGCDINGIGWEFVTDLILNVALVAFILGSGWVATQLYVKNAYYKCAGCGNLNARRRSECRICKQPLP